MSIIVLAFGLQLFASSVGSPPTASPVECVFEHPRYAGACVEQVTPDDSQTPRQACEAVLACLNNTQCVKSYCQATTLRGGWTLVSPGPAPETTRKH